MTDVATTLEAKKKRLEVLRQSRSGAQCAREHSSEADVRREIEVAELEEEIKKLEAQIGQDYRNEF